MRRENWFPTENSHICSLHFESKFMYEVNDRRRLYNNAVPTIFNFPSHLKKYTVERQPPTKRDLQEISANTLRESAMSTASSSLRSSEHDHTYRLPSPRKLKRNLDQVVDKLGSLRKKYKSSSQAAERQKRRVSKYKSIVEGLEKRLSESGNSVVLNSFTGVGRELLELQGQKNFTHYPDSVRKFALTVHFYSANAYRYLRKFFKLPHTRTLRNWATSIGGNPGFTDESFIKLAHEVNSSSGPIFCSLMFDVMCIKKDLTWDGKQICGYVDLVHGYIDSDNSDVVREALVFMVNSIQFNSIYCHKN